MAAGLVLRFPSDVGEPAYDQVNALLGFDPRTGEGDWPAGLQSHSAGPSDQGWVVSEIWESREAQGAFMEAKLGPALAEMPMPEVLWFDVVANLHRH